MKISEIAIEELKEAEYNPRQMTDEQYKHLRESVEKFGLVDPLIVNQHPDRKNVLVGGHQRLRVAKDLGYKTVPVVFIELDPEKEKELNLRLNKNLGQWDFDLLANNFSEDFLFSIGFTPHELGIVPLEKDEDELGDHLQSYLTGNIRQIVLYFTAGQYDEIIPKMKDLMAETGTESHSDLFLHFLEFYENNRDKKEGS